jgi:basic membrane protein A
VSRSVRAGIAALVAFAASMSAAWADDVLKVAAVFGTPVEEPWVARIHEALLDAQQEHGIRYSWSDDVAAEDLPGTLRSYAEQGYDLITGDSFAAEAAAREVAKDYPDIAFVFGSGGGPSAPNVSVFDNWLHEPAFLAGMIAGGITRSDRVGAVAAMPIPEVNRLVNAFCSGALEANPDIACEVAYIDAFFDPPRARAVARDMIEAGVDVLYAERLGAIEAAAEAGIAAIGNLADQAALAPDTVVTSVVWDMRPTFAFVLEQLRAGSLAPQDLGRLSFMRHGGAALAPYGRWESQLPDQLKALVAERGQAILDGTFRISIDEHRPEGSAVRNEP